MNKLMWSIVALLACFLFLDFLMPIVVLIAYLAGGWIFFLERVSHHVQISWPGVLSGVVALGCFVVGSQFFLRWLSTARQAMKASDDAAAGSELQRKWRWRWTIQLSAIVMLMFVAGISMIGITHQTVWLFTSQEPMWSSASGAARRAQSANNLKQIGLGLREYSGLHATFPAGSTVDPQGRSLHGWQTPLLPYLDQKELYDRIDMTQPWDSPRNAVVFKQPLPFFLNPSAHGPHVDSAGFAVSHYAANAAVLGGTEPRGAFDKNGLDGKTIVAGEAAGNFSPWGRPGNWRDPKLGTDKSPDGFGGNRPDGMTEFLMGDGSVQALSDDVDSEVFRALTKPDGQQGPRAER